MFSIFLISGRNVEYPEIASRILGVIRLWNDKHTMGRSMTSKVLNSIPIQILYQFLKCFS